MNKARPRKTIMFPCILVLFRLLKITLRINMQSPAFIFISRLKIYNFHENDSDRAFGGKIATALSHTCLAVRFQMPLLHSQS